MSVIDLSAFDPNDTTFMQMTNPTNDEPMTVDVGGEKIPAGITFHAPGSEAYVAAEKQQDNRGLARGKRKIPLTADLLRADRVTFLSDITVSFDHLGFPAPEGATGKAVFKALYADPKKGWIVAQANEHLADWAHFMKGSASS